MWTFWCIVFSIATVLLFLYSCTGNGWRKGLSGFICAWCFLVVVLIVGIDILELTSPSALDVYRGNTELKITSVNGIPTDTVVVFKNK